MNPSVQHAPMRIACPHCQAVYEVASPDPDVSFLCSRCHNEFRIGDHHEIDAQNAQKAQDADTQLGLFDSVPIDQAQLQFHHHPDDSIPRPPLFLDHLEPIQELEPERGNEEKIAELPKPSSENISLQGATKLEKLAKTPQPTFPHSESSKLSETDELAAPERQAPRILTWLSWVMLAIAIAGFAYNHASWSENLWLRSLMLNLDFPIKVHASDWRIPPKSVHAEWIRRDNGSSVLVIEGKVENRLHTELTPPWIQVTVYDALHSNKTVKRMTMAITLPPAVNTIEHAPWVEPPQDKAPVAATGNRGFVLVMDHLPKQAGEFTLDVVPSLYR